MKCDVCGGAAATIHIKQVSEDVTVELHLCEECAAAKGIGQEAERTDFSISSLLTGLVDITKGDQKQHKVCPACGMTIENLKKRATLGCNECYAVFAKEIRGTVGRMYGRTAHKGKLPKRLATYKTLLIDVETLKRQMKVALRNEDYEQAARLRDRIADLKGQASDG